MFQARKNPDGSITLPMMPKDDSLPPGVFIDGVTTVFPDSPHYAAAEKYLNATTNPFGTPDDGEEQSWLSRWS